MAHTVIPYPCIPVSLWVVEDNWGTQIKISALLVHYEGSRGIPEKQISDEDVIRHHRPEKKTLCVAYSKSATKKKCLRQKPKEERPFVIASRYEEINLELLFLK